MRIAQLKHPTEHRESSAGSVSVSKSAGAGPALTFIGGHARIGPIQTHVLTSMEYAGQRGGGSTGPRAPLRGRCAQLWPGPALTGERMSLSLQKGKRTVDLDARLITWGSGIYILVVFPPGHSLARDGVDGVESRDVFVIHRSSLVADPPIPSWMKKFASPRGL